MFIIIFLKKIFIKKNKYKMNLKNETTIWKYIIITIFDILSWNLRIIGLTFSSNLLIHIFQGDIIIVTLIGSIVYLKNKYYRHHFLGLLLIVIGLFFFRNNYIINSGTIEKPVIGIICLIISQILSSIVFILEERLLKQYENSTLKLIGLEGLSGFLFYLIFLIIFQFISCNNWVDYIRENICSND